MFRCELCDFASLSKGELHMHKWLHKSHQINTPQSQYLGVSISTMPVGRNPDPMLLSRDILNLGSSGLSKKHSTSLDDNDDSLEQKSNINLKRKGDKILELDSGDSKKAQNSLVRCFFCDFSTYKKCDVDRHERTSHKTMDGLFSCPQCEYETAKRRDLKRHYSRKHETLYKCSHCSFENTIKADFDHHAALHERKDVKQLYYCPTCSYSSDRKSMVERHEAIHKECNFACDFCDFKCRRDDYLQRHLKKKHPDRSVTFYCKTCPFQTVIEDEFLNHIDLHTQSLNHTLIFECPYPKCDDEFPDFDAVKLHQSETKHSPNLVLMKIEEQQ